MRWIASGVRSSWLARSTRRRSLATDSSILSSISGDGERGGELDEFVAAVLQGRADCDDDQPASTGDHRHGKDPACVADAGNRPVVRCGPPQRLGLQRGQQL